VCLPATFNLMTQFSCCCIIFFTLLHERLDSSKRFFITFQHGTKLRRKFSHSPNSCRFQKVERNFPDLQIISTSIRTYL
jgi:hypothetical protein